MLLLLWSSSASETEDGPPSSWPSCDPMVCACAADGETGRIVADCASRGLSSVPAGLPANTSALNLSGNHLSGPNSTRLLSSLPRLLSLDLSRNRLDSFSASSHYYLLERLDLSSNEISSIRQISLDGLVSLRELRLAGNRIVSLPAGAFGGAGMLLRSLDLRNNKIVSLEAGSLVRIRNKIG